MWDILYTEDGEIADAGIGNSEVVLGVLWNCCAVKKSSESEANAGNVVAGEVVDGEVIAGEVIAGEVIAGDFVAW